MSPNPGLCMLGYMFNLVPVVERRVPGSAPPSCRLLKLCVDGDMSRVCLVSPSVIQHDGGRPCLDYEWPGRAGWVDFRRDGRLSGLFIFSLPFLWSLPPNTPPRSLSTSPCVATSDFSEAVGLISEVILWFNLSQTSFLKKTGRGKLSATPSWVVDPAAPVG